MTGEHTSQTTRDLAALFPIRDTLPVAIVGCGPYRELHGHRHTSPDDAEQVAQLRELNDSLAAKVAEWKARAEKAEAALKAAEDDRHLTTPCA